ncbi:MAG: 3-oxoacid CoA-transferase subunit A [Trueperaceae bacterium]|nr:3-oxoacid CoA-transferase subunit A [Trueperaceae bacterium]
MITAAAEQAQAQAEALAREVPDGARVMVSGFGEPGTPFLLLDALARFGGGDLTVIKNDANEPGMGVGRLLAEGRIRRLIASHIGLNREAVAAWNEGRIEVEIHPQGVLAERIRCGGAGLPAFLGDLDPELLPDTPEPREVVTWRGRTFTIEPAMRADVALVHAHRGDRAGNLSYRATARNFAPLMATAAERVWVEVDALSDEPLDPDHVVTPGAFVDAVIAVPEGFDPGTKAARIRRGERP